MRTHLGKNGMSHNLDTPKQFSVPKTEEQIQAFFLKRLVSSALEPDPIKRTEMTIKFWIHHANELL